jgi:hypothetical protein
LKEATSCHWLVYLGSILCLIQGMKLTTHIHLVPRLMCGARPPLFQYILMAWYLSNRYGFMVWYLVKQGDSYAFYLYLAFSYYWNSVYCQQQVLIPLWYPVVCEWVYFMVMCEFLRNLTTSFQMLLLILELTIQHTLSKENKKHILVL